MSWLVRPSQVSRWSKVLRAARHTVGPRARLVCPPPAISANLSQVCSRNYASYARTRENIEPLLQKMDEDVRRVGRIHRKDLDDVLEEFRIRNTVTSSQSLLIIRCCGSLVPEEIPEERTKLVNEVWKTLLDRGVPVDISHYNALLRVYIENDHKFQTADLLTEIESKGLQPNRVTYQRLMWHYCQNGDIDGASIILEKMREKNFPLTEAVLDALVLGHIRQNNLEGARSVLTAMGTAGITPTSRTYSILISGSARVGDIATVKKMISECESNEIFFSDREFMEILEEFAVGGHIEHVDFMLSKMQKSVGYNQEAINLILRLINKKCEGVALSVVKTLSKSFSNKIDNTPMYQSAFYIRHLVRAKVPSDVIIAQCGDLYSNGCSPKAYYIAAYESLLAGNTELAYKVFDKLESSGDTIRQHYFWPLFVSQGRAEGVKGVKSVLEKMVLGYKIFPSIETLREYVIPHIKTNPKKMVEILRECNVLPISSVRSVLLYCLSENNLKDAAELAGIYGTKRHLHYLVFALVNAFKKVKDVDSLVKIVTMACSHSEEIKSQVEDTDEKVVDYKTDHREAVGRLIHSIVMTNLTQVQEILPGLLEKLHLNGVGITSSWAAKIQESLGGRIDNSITNLLVKLTSEELSPVEYDIEPMPRIQRTTEQLQMLITNLEGRGENPMMLKRQLINQLVRAKDVDGLNVLMSKLESEKFHFTSGVMCQIMDMYCQMNDIDKAMEIYKSIMEREPDFALDSVKIVRLVRQLIKNNRFEEGMEIIESTPIYSLDEKEKKQLPFQHNSLCWQLLNDIAEAGDAEKLNRVFDALVQKKVFEPSNIMLGPLIKVHLNKGNTSEALKVFEDCCNRYRCTPWKNELNKKLIMEEDATGLQKLTDISTLIHGEVNSLYDLVFGFIECGRLKQARRILETPGMRLRNQRINIACERYNLEGKVECLEGLLEATRDLSHIDRSEVFNQLLNSYIRAEDVEKAVGLWTLLQEENVPPTDKFLISLGGFLKSKDIEVPFVIPKESDTSKTGSQTWVDKVKPNKPDPVQSYFSELFKNQDFETAGEEIIKQFKSNNPPKYNYIKYTLNKLSNKGNHALIEKIGSFLSDKNKKMVAYENKRCFAKTVAGLSGEYLDELENEIDSATEKNLEVTLSKFPVGAMFGILNSNTYDRVLNIAQKYSAHGSKLPFNVLWSYHLIENNFDEAKKIWDEHLINEKYVFFWKIVKVAEETKNIKLVDALIDFIETSKHKTDNMTGFAYGKKIDVLLMNENVNYAMKTLEDCLKKGITLECFHRNTLLKLRDAVNLSGSKFNHVIPEKSNLSVYSEQ